MSCRPRRGMRNLAQVTLVHAVDAIAGVAVVQTSPSVELSTKLPAPSIATNLSNSGDQVTVDKEVVPVIADEVV